MKQSPLFFRTNNFKSQLLEIINGKQLEPLVMISRNKNGIAVSVADFEGNMELAQMLSTLVDTFIKDKEKYARR